MLEHDERDQLLVTNSFTDDTALSSNPYYTLITPSSNTSESSFERHPLRSRSVSPASHCITHDIHSIVSICGEDETRPGLTRLFSSGGLSSSVTTERGQVATSKPPQGGVEFITHPIGPSDSFAGVALRYGVSIAAIRRANQLWPSDPIHLRTELLIPHGDCLPARFRHTQCGNTDVRSRTSVEPTSSISSNTITSSFVAARKMIFSFPARISLESLSSKTSASEDLELDDLQIARVRKISATQSALTEGGYELSTLAAPCEQYRRPDFPLSSPSPRSPSHNFGSIPPVVDFRSPSIPSSPTVFPGRQHHTQPFTVRPVRTSQLEPEPVMELPVRHSRIL